MRKRILLALTGEGVYCLERVSASGLDQSQTDLQVKDNDSRKRKDKEKKKCRVEFVTRKMKREKTAGKRLHCSMPILSFQPN